MRGTNEENAKIEVTDEMIDAGVEELALFERSDPGAWIVAAVYREMERVARLKKPHSD